MSEKPTTVKAYLDSLPEDRRKALRKVRAAVNKGLPKGYKEGLQYGMLGWFVPHRIYPDGYHCDPKQPGAETTRRIELVQPFERTNEDFLRQVTRKLVIVHKTQNESDDPSFVTIYEFAERVAVALSRFFHESSVADSAWQTGRLGHRRDP